MPRFQRTLGYMTNLDVATQNAPSEEEISVPFNDNPKRMEGPVIIPVVMGPTVSDNIPTVVGCMPAGVLAYRCNTPYRDLAPQDRLPTQAPSSAG